MEDDTFRLLIDLYLCCVDDANGDYDNFPAENLRIIKSLQSDDNIHLFFTKIICSNTLLSSLEIVSEERLVLGEFCLIIYTVFFTLTHSITHSLTHAVCVYKLPPINKKGNKKFDQITRISATITASNQTIKALNRIFVTD